MVFSATELLLIGFVIGTFGTLIGAGGGFLLVPFLLFADHSLTPETVTAVSMAIVCANAISGSIAYKKSGRIDYKAGLLFAAFTIPGSILGVMVTAYIPKVAFRIVFGVLLLVIALSLFIKKKEKPAHNTEVASLPKGWRLHTITDKEGTVFRYSYNQYKGIFISIIVGFLSPLLGIGGGIIHVPALVQWLSFPVYIATATSHFILAIMSAVSVLVHIIQGNYEDAAVLRMTLFLACGAVAGAQLGAYLSHKIKTKLIVRALAVCLGIVGLRLLLGNIL